MRKLILNIIVLSLLSSAGIYAGDNSSFGSSNDPEIRLKLKERSEHSLLYEKTKPQQKKYDLIDKDNFTLKNYHKMKPYKVNPVKMTVLGVVAAGVFTGFHIYYSNTWWKDKRDYFKFAADGYYARNIDKASHIYTANFFTVATSVAYEWTGLSPKKSLLFGALTSLAYETYIEVNDGFAPNWGFDWGDMGANVFGAVYPFLQSIAPPLQYVNFKWSFKPEWLKKKVANQDDLLDDYTNMTFWLSVNPMIALPKSVTKAKFYPNFLALALGMSISNASHVTGSSSAKVQWLLALDIDVKELPGKSDFMVKFKKILNFFHFPMPAVKISPEGVWYGLYF